MMKKFHYLRKWLKIITVLAIVLINICTSETGFAIQPGSDPQQVQQDMPKTGEIVPGIPGRAERPIPSSQPDARAIVEQPRQIQKRWADNYLVQSVRNVTDPQDGLRKDGRVAVLEGMNSQVVYHFYKENKVVNVPNQSDLIVYTHDKGGFDGPYNVFVANFGDSNWTQVGADVMGTAAFDLPPTLESVELILISNRHNGATYIEGIEGTTFTSGSGSMQGTFSYFPESLIGLRVEQLNCIELERARMILTPGGGGYQVIPLGEVEVKWNSPIKNEWKQEEFHIEAQGEYEIYVSDSRGMENFIGRLAGAQSIDLPQNMTDASKVRIRNHNNNRPVTIYTIVGRR